MFSQHPKSIYWSNKNISRPDEVKLNTHKKYWFDCNMCGHSCGHSFESSLLNINTLNRWCSYCANKRLCDVDTNCNICFEKSFASICYSKNWSDKNKLTPYHVFKYSHKKYLFNCPLCSHLFEQSLSHISKDNTCPYCANRLLCNDKNKVKPIEVTNRSI